MLRYLRLHGEPQDLQPAVLDAEPPRGLFDDGDLGRQDLLVDHRQEREDSHDRPSHRGLDDDVRERVGKRRVARVDRLIEMEKMTLDSTMLSRSIDSRPTVPCAVATACIACTITAAWLPVG